MQKKYIYASLPVIVALLAIVGTDITGLAYAQETPTLPDEIPVNFRTSDAVIIGLGVLGGLTVAFLGKSEASKETNFKFDGRKFARPVVIAVLTSIPLAIAAAMQFTELNLVTMFLIYAATMGIAEVSGRIKRR